MGIDHGLGGKDSEKSRLRRQKKAKRIKTTVNKLLENSKSEFISKKKEITFDELARVAFLTGFGKRKQERRKFGIGMQILKEHKQRKDAARERIQTLKAINDQSKVNFNLGGMNDKDGDGEGDEEEEVAPSTVRYEENVYSDDATLNMFGSSVSVVIDDTPIAATNPTFQSMLASLHEAEEDKEEDGEEDGEEGEEDDDAASDEGADHHSIISNKTGKVSNASMHSMQSLKSLKSYQSYQAKQAKKQPKPISRFDKAMKKAKVILGNRKSKKYQQRKSDRKGSKGGGKGGGGGGGGDNSTGAAGKKLVEKALGRKMKSCKRKGK